MVEPVGLKEESVFFVRVTVWFLLCMWECEMKQEE